MVLAQEGWYTDPYGRHEARWLSDGVPTRLVRDGEHESYDEPPEAPPTQGWLPIEPASGSVTSLDTLRVDDAESQWTPSLDELNRQERSTALTTQAHPWIIARSWLTPSRNEPAPLVPKAVLVSGGILSGVLVVLSAWVWLVEAVALLGDARAAWVGALISVTLALDPVVGTYLFWRVDRRAGVPVSNRLQRTVAASGLLAALMLVIWVAAHLP